MVSSDSEKTTFVSAGQAEKAELEIVVISGISTLSILLQLLNHPPPPLFPVQAGKKNSPARFEQLAKHPVGMRGILRFSIIMIIESILHLAGW